MAFLKYKVNNFENNFLSPFFFFVCVFVFFILFACLFFLYSIHSFCLFIRLFNFNCWTRLFFSNFLRKIPIGRKFLEDRESKKTKKKWEKNRWNGRFKNQWPPFPLSLFFYSLSSKSMVRYWLKEASSPIQGPNLLFLHSPNRAFPRDLFFFFFFFLSFSSSPIPLSIKVELHERRMQTMQLFFFVDWCLVFCLESLPVV